MPIDIDDQELEDRERQADPTEDTDAPAVAAYQPAMAASDDGETPQGTTPPDRATVRDAAAYQPAMGAEPIPNGNGEAVVEPIPNGDPGAKPVPQPMGGAVAPSSAAKDLGEFAAATGTAKPAAPTPLQSVGPAPQPPTASPDLAKTEADLRAHVTPTPKYDPQTGKTLDQYHPGVGSRIGRAFLDLAHGGIPAVAEGAMGDRSKPGYYGPGAVNSQYFRDEWARQQAEGADKAKIDSLQREDTTAQRDWKNKDAAYKDDTRRAYEQTTTQERSRHQQETEGLTARLRDAQDQAADIKQQLADAKDPATKLNAEIDARGNIAKRLGLQGQAAQDYIIYGDKGGMIGIDRVKIRQEEEKLGIERDKASRDKKAVNDLGYTTDEQRGINVEAPGAMKRLNDMEMQRARRIADGIRNDDDKKDLAGIDADITATRKIVQDAATKVRNARPTPGQRPGAATPATDEPSTPDGTITQPEFSPRTGAPLLPPGAKLYNDDGSPAEPVQTGTSPEGRPMVGIKPPAPVQTSGSKPAAAPNQPARTISKAKVQELADKNKLSYADAEKQFKAKNYTIQ